MSASVRAAGRSVTRRRGHGITIAAAAVCGLSLLVAGLALGRAPLAWSPLAVPIAIFLVVALLRPFEPAPGEKLSLAASVAFFGAAILPPASAVAAVAAAGVMTRLAQRRSLLSMAVNTGVLAAATAAAGALLAVRPLGAATLVAAGIGYSLVTLAGIGTMVAASSGPAAVPAFVRREALPTATLVSLGAVAALLFAREPLAIVLVAAPLVLIEDALRRVAALRAALAALREASALQQQFTEDAAHELRTPLTALRGDLAFIRRDRLDPDEAEALAAAEGTALRLERLAERLLVLSRAGAATEPSAADLADLAREAVIRAAPRPGVQIRFAGPPALGVGLPAELASVVIQDLVANAVAYTERGTIEVRVAAEGGEAVCTVRDTGCGIPAAELGRVFDRFYRGQRARALAPGSGLGLAIVRRIAERYGGSVTLTSRVGEGTTATVRLPAAAASAALVPAMPRP